MTTYTSEPGTRLGGRYRLEDRIAAGSGWAAWKAIDETLARAVTVFTLAQGFPRIAEVVTAARAASRLTDPRLAQFFDVEDAWERAYIVMEWAAGETLGDLLSGGPLEPARAARMISEAAAALSAAHAAGVAHMCLSPGSLRWSQTGEVKVVGLGIDAALSGTAADDPVLADTRGLGHLLYAALTGYWPGSEYPGLPSAPVADGEPRSPRQVVAGIPIGFSDLACRAMQLQSREGSPPLTSPGELASALRATLPPAPIPSAPPRPARRERHAEHQSDSYRDPYRQGRDRPRAGPQPYDGYPTDEWRPHDLGQAEVDWPGSREASHDPYSGGADESWSDERLGPRPGAGEYGRERPPRPGGRRKRQRLMVKVPFLGGAALPVVPLAAVAAGLVAVAVVAAWLRPGGSHRPQTSGHHHVKVKTHLTGLAVTLVPQKATGFDPLTSRKDDPGNENTQYAPYAIDSNPRTAWDSQWYKSANFGGLKAGSGLLIEMGKPVTFKSVSVTFGSAQPGADVKLLVGNSAARSAANLNSMTTVASARDVSGIVPFRISGTTTGRFLVIWFTKLPPKAGHGHWFMAEVFNVAIRGIS
jgi:hypothetical protein